MYVYHIYRSKYTYIYISQKADAKSHLSQQPVQKEMPRPTSWFPDTIEVGVPRRKENTRLCARRLLGDYFSNYSTKQEITSRGFPDTIDVGVPRRKEYTRLRARRLIGDY